MALKPVRQILIQLLICLRKNLGEQGVKLLRICKALMEILEIFFCCIKDPRSISNCNGRRRMMQLFKVASIWMILHFKFF